MKKTLFACLAGSLLALAGCKTIVYAPVTYSEIFGNPQMKWGALVLEVPSCTDTTDKFESNSVIEAKQKVPYVFQKAEYVKCERKGFNSYATFKVPFQVGGIRDNCGKDQVCVYRSRNNKYVNAFVGEEILNKAKELGDIDGDDLKFTLVFDNDTGKAVNWHVISAYVDGSEPITNGDISINKDASNFLIILDNVASSRLLKGLHVNIVLDKDRKEEPVK